MSDFPKSFVTPEQYLERERRADFKSEYLRGEVFAMAGTSIEHSQFKDNFARHAGNQLDDGGYRVFTSDLRVRVQSTGLYTYTDVMIVCGEPHCEDKELDTLLNPTLIVKVLSETTEKYDRGKKFEHYRGIESLREYVLIAQERPSIHHYVRRDNGKWDLTFYDDLSKSFEAATIPLRIALKDIYKHVPLPPEEQK